MKYNKKATSIIEVMVVLLIVVTGVIGMYKVYGNSQKLSNSTNNKIQAIQIAREGIEAVKNIRNTNWIMFGSDHENCWNTLNYDETCIGNSGTTTDIPNNTSFTISQDSTDSSWKLTEQSAPIGNFLDASGDYRTNFTVYIDSDGFYTQSSTATSTQPLFTREIQIQYLEQDNSPALDSNAPKMQVKSIVQWLDSSGNTPHNVTLTTELTNWKK